MKSVHHKIWTFGRMVMGIILFALCLSLPSCSTTDKLPEDEVLYVGIKDVHYLDEGYEVQIKDNVTTDQAVAESNVMGEQTPIADETIASKPTNAQKRILKAKADKWKDEVNLCQTEVEAVLDFAPNSWR